MRTTLAHDLMVLSLDPVSGRRRKAQDMGFGLAGAVLADLALDGRIGLDGRKVAVLDPSPVGLRLPDELLSRLITDRPRWPGSWVHRFARPCTTEVLEDLQRREIVSRRRARMLLVPIDVYPLIDAGVRDRLTTDLRALLDAGGTPSDGDARHFALASLVLAVGLHAEVFPGLPKRAIKARLKELEPIVWPRERQRAAVLAAVAAVTRAIDSQRAAAAG